MRKVEALARAYCEELGYDPDARVSLGAFGARAVRWRMYEAAAERQLAGSAWAAALEKVAMKEGTGMVKDLAGAGAAMAGQGQGVAA